MAQNVDIAILGAGPGGYVAAIYAAKRGMKVVLVEKEKVGGVCLHKGCIPSKSLLKSAEVYHQLKNSDQYGVSSQGISLDMAKVQERKHKVISQLHKGVEHLLAKHAIDVYQGTGRILGPSIFSPLAGTIAVESSDGGEPVMIVPKYVLIATGSRPKMLPGIPHDGKYMMTSDDALQMEELPKSILIIGGGVIGIEWASLLSDFEVEVTIIEAAPRILPTEDADISREMERSLKKRKVKVMTNTTLLPETYEVKDDQIHVRVKKGTEELLLSADQGLCCIGRKANVEDIGLQNTSIQLEHGVIQVNSFMQTKESHIYAIGDVVGGYQLAHVATREGMLAVNHMVGEESVLLDPQTIPRGIYSRPEVASMGYTEEEAKELGYSIKVAKFPFRGTGKSQVLGEVDGFVKMISDEKSEDLLGVHIIGPHATELISQYGVAKTLDATAWEMAQVIYPHPTLSEAFGEAALSVMGQVIHG